MYREPPRALSYSMPEQISTKAQSASNDHYCILNRRSSQSEQHIPTAKFYLTLSNNKIILTGIQPYIQMYCHRDRWRKLHYLWNNISIQTMNLYHCTLI